MTRFNDILNGIKKAVDTVKSNMDIYPENEYKEDRLNLMSENTPNPEKMEEQNEYKQSYYDMSVGSLKAIMNHAEDILDYLDNPVVKENLTAPHLQGMIAVAEDHLRSIHDFVMFAETDDEEIESEANNKPGLWENIRKKRERKGKKYRPAKPGDKDRPNPESWKRAQK